MSLLVKWGLEYVTFQTVATTVPRITMGFILWGLKNYSKIHLIKVCRTNYFISSFLSSYYHKQCWNIFPRRAKSSLLVPSLPFWIWCFQYRSITPARECLADSRTGILLYFAVKSWEELFWLLYLDSHNIKVFLCWKMRVRLY